MTHQSENEWSEEFLASAERALYVLQRHMAIAARLKTKAGRGQCVHHINGDVYDNRPENLMIVERNER